MNGIYNNWIYVYNNRTRCFLTSVTGCAIWFRVPRCTIVSTVRVDFTEGNSGRMCICCAWPIDCFMTGRRCGPFRWGLVSLHRVDSRPALYRRNFIERSMRPLSYSAVRAAERGILALANAYWCYSRWATLTRVMLEFRCSSGGSSVFARCVCWERATLRAVVCDRFAISTSIPV